MPEVTKQTSARGQSCDVRAKHIDTPRIEKVSRVVPVLSIPVVNEGEFVRSTDCRSVKIVSSRGTFYFNVVPGKTTYQDMSLYIQNVTNVAQNNVWYRYGLHFVTERNFSTLSEGFHPDQTPITVHFKLLGGSHIKTIDVSGVQLVDTQYIIHECENTLQGPNRSTLQLQSITSGDLMQIFSRLVQPYKAHLSEYIIKLLEDIIILGYDLNKAGTFSDYIVAITTFAKLRSPKSLVNTVAECNLVEYFLSLFKDDEKILQSDSSDLGGLLDQYEAFKKSEMWKKIYKLFTHVMTSSILQNLGLPFNCEQLNRLKTFVYAQKLWGGVDFLSVILDTCLFIFERGILFVRTGDLSSFVHSDSNYIKWKKDVEKIKLRFHQLNDPQFFGFSEAEFIADLESAIERGKNIKKHCSKLSDIEKRITTGTLSELQFKHCEFLSSRRARENRKAPFSILIDGDSSVGKSTITNMIFYHFGKLFNLPVGDEYKYSKNPVANFWDGFRSSMWCLQLDDVSFMHPNKASEGDPSVMEIIQVVNNVPYVPDQASIEDKGKVPLRCELCIATTNTDHLNAHAYFSCPIAVRRRLPYVIRAIVKPAYATPEGMLDSSKTEGDIEPYPDYWIWVVQRVKPVKEDSSNRLKNAILEEIERYDSVYDFLMWFNQTAKSFRETQTLVCERQNKLRDIKLCDHGLPQVKCIECKDRFMLQADTTTDIEWTTLSNPIEVEMVRRAQKITRDHIPTWQIRADTIKFWQNLNFMQRWYRSLEAWCIMKFVGIFLWVYNSNSIIFVFWLFSLRCCRFLPGIHLIYDVILYRMYHDDATWRMMADKVRYFGMNKKRIVMAVAGITSLYAAYKLYRFQKSRIVNLNSETTNEILEDDSPRSVSAKTGISPILDSKRVENPWVRDHYELTTFDVTPSITSSKGLGLNWLIERVEKNVLRLEFRLEVDGKVKVHRVCAVGLRGMEYVFNTHCLPLTLDTHKWQLRVYFKKPSELLDSSIEFPFKKSMITKLKDTDISIINIRYLPPCKDITRWLPQSTMRGQHKGVLVTRTSTGAIIKREIANVKYEVNCSTPIMNMDLWTGYADKPTDDGDCGSAMVLQTPVGPVFAGIHILGAANGCVCSIALNQDLISYCKTTISDAAPVISAPSAERELTDLHNKSTLRYLQKGQAHVYGSFAGFRPRHKSSVSKMLICNAMLTRGYSIKQGAPVMAGWEPWRIALLEMTKRDYSWDLDILDEVKQNFLDDITNHKNFAAELSKVEIYDNKTAINGAPGVAYVDKINRNTSAGNPWKKSKKFFMKKVDYQGYIDAVIFEDEIMDRVDAVIDGYHKGERYAPVFCGHLKDEAVSFKKIDAKKTRVFSGAPLDWSLVVRKYLLGLIRMMQSNKYMFECAPGTVAQSQEWSQMYNYLQQFGDNMIAGDYASYDKSMLSIFILAAYDIIIEICRMAGYSDADLQVIKGIAIDTAYAWMDFNGDLVQFFGSNPSGHPLTVIINCLVNSLYMRYAYRVLNPLKEAKTFRLNVALMTYGDDNIAGVNINKAPWFNHTAIAKVFADVGVTYTMADKESVSVPYISIKDATFLKRSWVWNDEVGAYLCPLDHDSINKMLTVGVKSKTICEEAQSIAIISSACREYFFYGRSKFEEKRKMFQEVINEVGIQTYQNESTLPSWNHLKDEFLSYDVDIMCF